MEALINKLRQDYPQMRFAPGEVAHWSPETKTIIYAPGGREAIWSVLHELGHGLLGHTSYESDASLLHKETTAWAKAIELANGYGAEISSGYIEDCLDTYRDWLHKRSACPSCRTQGLQQTKALYRCFNCQATWKVTEHRFCRPYRLKIALNRK